MPEIIDSYSEDNFSAAPVLSAVHPSSTPLVSATGQTVTLSDNYSITSCKFYLRKRGIPLVDIIVRLYNLTGTPGTDAIPTGAALTSSDVISSSILTDTVTLYEFIFLNPYYLSSGNYGVSLEIVSGTIDLSNTVDVGNDGTSSTHSGNPYRYCSSAWEYLSFDRIFYLYGNLGKDIGIRVRTTSETIAIPVMDLDDVTHQVRIRGTDVVYGIPLLELDDPNASPVRISTSAGVKALPKLS